MKRFIYELLFSGIVLMCGLISFTYIFDVTNNDKLKTKVYDLMKTDDKTIEDTYTIDEIDSSSFIIENIIIDKNAEFDYHDYVSAHTKGMIDLSSFITMEGDVDINKSGEYPVKFYLRWNGNYLVKSSIIYVRGDNKVHTLNAISNIGDKISLYNEDEEELISMTLDSEELIIENLVNGKYYLNVNDIIIEFEILDNDVDLGVI